MKLEVFCIYDSAVESFGRPFFEPTKGSAIRVFSDECNNVSSAFHKHPAHYTLFHVATYNSDTAAFSSLQTPHSLGLALDFVSKPAAVVSSVPNDVKLKSNELFSA